MILSALFACAAALQTPTLTLPGTLDNMPIVGYGTWLSKKGEVYEGTKKALQLGYRHIDEAWVYMNEQEVGRAITEALADGTVTSRNELWITSKLWQCHHRPELVREGCVDSLTKLGVECLDLYLIHFPVAFVPGCVEATSAEQVEDVPIEDTWKAMEALVDEGLVRSEWARLEPHRTRSERSQLTAHRMPPPQTSACPTLRSTTSRRSRQSRPSRSR